jgi:hypothetical protein
MSQSQRIVTLIFVASFVVLLVGLSALACTLTQLAVATPQVVQVDRPILVPALTIVTQQSFLVVTATPLPSGTPTITPSPTPTFASTHISTATPTPSETPTASPTATIQRPLLLWAPLISTGRPRLDFSPPKPMGAGCSGSG